MGLEMLVPAVAGAIGSLINAGKQRRTIRKAMKSWVDYKESPYAENRLGLAETILNGESKAAKNAEANVAQNQADTIAAGERGATDSSQLLALATGAQAQSNDAYNQIQGQESQDYMNRVNNLNGANDAMTAELDKKYQNQMQKFMTQLNLNIGANNAAGQGFANSMGLLGSALGTMQGMKTGLGKLFF
jgi:hypothetical protein